MRHVNSGARRSVLLNDRRAANAVAPRRKGAKMAKSFPNARGLRWAVGLRPVLSEPIWEEK